ncbi:MAG: hypothetical protein PHP62_04855 [Candidatus Moranbacteria bacterium]|nr:hypothetical protein [Candidatus Moranbacteria bacterium]
MKFISLELGQNCIRKSDILKNSEELERMKKIATDAKFTERGSLLQDAVHQGGVKVNCVGVDSGTLSWINPDENVIRIL